MKIDLFKNSNIKEAKVLTELVWGDFFKNDTLEFQKIVFDFTFEYYDLNRNFSFAISDEKLNAFLLSYRKEDKNNKYEEYLDKIKAYNPYEQKKLSEVFDFIDFSSKKVKNLMSENDILIGLFVSIKKGCGSELLKKLNETCLKNNIDNIYLWSDNTCDYQYYIKHNFDLIEEFTYNVNNRKINTLIFKKAIML